MYLVEFQLLLLLLVANGAPVLADALFRDRFAWPIDAGIILRNGRPLLGHSKTWRGVLLAIGAAIAMAQLQGLSLKVGLIVGLFAMLGDVLSSFIKRRMGLPSSSMALGLDQILESLLPLLAVREIFGLTWISILQLVAGFFFLELLLSKLLYRINIRRRPY